MNMSAMTKYLHAASSTSHCSFQCVQLEMAAQLYTQLARCSHSQGCYGLLLAKSIEYGYMPVVQVLAQLPTYIAV